MGWIPENDESKIVDQNQIKNAEINVKIMDFGLTACVNITPPMNGGVAVTMDALMAALVKNNVTKNLNLLKMKTLSATPVYNEDIIVATGTRPIDGKDGTMDFKVRIEKKGKPKQIENGKVDYYDLDLIENVHIGQLLCVLTKPTIGTPGMSVTGEVLKQRVGKAAAIVAGPNTQLSEDGTQITSKINGHVVFEYKKIIVFDTYTLNQDVDTSTGNISVAGNLVIRGMVTSGLTIEAGGFINVAGVVDSATVKAGRDLNLLGGSIGSTISCGGNLKSRYIENCTVTARGDIVAEYILNSNVWCRKSLRTEGAISKILGGTCVVMNNVVSRTIGSAAGIRTKIEIGNDPEIVERQRELSDLIPELEKQLRSMDPLLKLLTQLEAANRLDEEKAQTLEKVRLSYSSHESTLEGAQKEMIEIGNMASNNNFGKVLCTGVMFPGTVVTIGPANYTVTTNLMNASLYYSEGSVAVGTAR